MNAKDTHAGYEYPFLVEELCAGRGNTPEGPPWLSRARWCVLMIGGLLRPSPKFPRLHPMELEPGGTINAQINQLQGPRRLWQRVGSSSSRRLCCIALHRARAHPELLGNLVQASPLRLRQPLKAASVKCIRAQFRTRDLLRDFRRPRPCCTHGCLPPIEPLLSPAHYFRRSKKLLPRHFHDPPPDGQNPIR
jgi:hypothetical protein